MSGLCKFEKINYSSSYTLIGCLIPSINSNGNGNTNENNQKKTNNILILPASTTATTDKVCFSIENILSQQECKNIISHTEQSGLFKPAMLNVGYGFEVYDPEARNSDRCIIDDTQFAESLFTRLKYLIPSTYRSHDGTMWDAIGLNERFRILRYNKDHEFPWHRDAQYVRKGAIELSFYTLMIYLNEGGGVGFSGGSTSFSDGDSNVIEYVPKTGGVVVFDHGLLHEGSKLLDGKKYAIRTDVMYKKTSHVCIKKRPRKVGCCQS